MRCPRGDGELAVRKSTGELPLMYYRCDSCGGHWTAGFDANYLRDSEFDDVPRFPGQDNDTLMTCPQCRALLARVLGDVVAPGVLLFRCPKGHGYFFPAGELGKFKAAQEAKVTYHKLWGVPLPPLRSVLLASIVILGAIGSAVVYTQFRQTQVSQSQAKEVIQFHEVITDQTTRTATIIARTSQPLELTVTVSQVGAYMRMSSPDGRTHSLRFGAVPTGTYFYSFSYTAGGKLTHSESFSFSMP